MVGECPAHTAEVIYVQSSQWSVLRTHTSDFYIIKKSQEACICVQGRLWFLKLQLCSEIQDNCHNQNNFEWWCGDLCSSNLRQPACVTCDKHVCQYDSWLVRCVGPYISYVAVAVKLWPLFVCIYNKVGMSKVFACQPQRFPSCFWVSGCVSTLVGAGRATIIGQSGKCKDRCLVQVRIAGNCAWSSAIDLDTLPAGIIICR